MNRKTPLSTARLVLINAKLYELERGKEVTRYRFSADTLRRISGRRTLRDRFLTDLENEIAELGWILIDLRPDFGVLDLSRVDGWVKLSSKRLVDQKLLGLDDEEVENKFDDIFEPIEEHPDDAQ